MKKVIKKTPQIMTIEFRENDEGSFIPFIKHSSFQCRASDLAKILKAIDAAADVLTSIKIDE